MGPGFRVNDPMNGIMWCSAFEFVFERGQVCYSRALDRQPGKYLLHVLDQNLMSTKLSSVGAHK